MSLPHETVLELMSFADGELEGEAKARAERLVAENDEAAQIVEAFRAPHIGAWLDDAMQQRAAEANADRIVEAVMANAFAGLHRGAVGQMRLPRVRTRSRRAMAIVAVAGSALALAAGVALYLRSAETAWQSAREHPSLASPGAPSGRTAPGAHTSAVAQQEPASRGVEVDDIDSPLHHVSVFEIPLNGATTAAMRPARASSVVIWIEDEPAGEK